MLFDYVFVTEKKILAQKATQKILKFELNLARYGEFVVRENKKNLKKRGLSR